MPRPTAKRNRAEIVVFIHNNVQIKSQRHILIDIYENIDAPSLEAGPSPLEHEV